MLTISLVSIILVIPDIHAPFQHKETIPFLQHVQKKFNCDRVVCLGDEVDYAALNRFGLDPNGHNAAFELSLAKSFLKEFYQAFPIVEVCESNHTKRPLRVAFEAGLPEELVMPYKQALEAPDGWSWHNRIIIDNVLYIHGEGYSGANGHVKAAKDNRMSTVIGHLHSNAGVQYFQAETNRIFAMNAGCLIDRKAYAFKYAKTIANKPTLGCGVIIDGQIAFWVPLLRDI